MDLPRTAPALPLEAPPGLSPAERAAWAHLRPLDADHGALWLERRGEAGWAMVIDHAAARGAWSVRMMLQLAAHSLRLAEQGGGLLLMSADPRSFSAGGDLRAVRGGLLEPGGAAAMHDLMVGALSRIAERAAPLVALLRGTALGGGAELLMWADEVIAEDGATIGFPQLRLGVSPGWGGGHRLQRRVGDPVAQRLLVEGAPMPAAWALERGLVDQLVAAGAGLAAANQRLAALDALPSGGWQAARALLFAPVPAEERALFISRWGGPEHRAALEGVRQGRSA